MYPSRLLVSVAVDSTPYRGIPIEPEIVHRRGTAGDDSCGDDFSECKWINWYKSGVVQRVSSVILFHLFLSPNKTVRNDSLFLVKKNIKRISCFMYDIVSHQLYALHFQGKVPTWVSIAFTSSNDKVDP